MVNATDTYEYTQEQELYIKKRAAMIWLYVILPIVGFATILFYYDNQHGMRVWWHYPIILLLIVMGVIGITYLIFRQMDKTHKPYLSEKE